MRPFNCSMARAVVLIKLVHNQLVQFMSKIIVFVVILILSKGSFHSCNRKLNNHNIRCVNYSTSGPIVFSDGSMVDFKTFFNVYYYEDLVMYQFPYYFDSTYDGKSILNKQERNNFFVYNRDSTWGYNYNPLNELQNNRRVKVDSMMRQTGLQSSNFDGIAKLQPVFSQFDTNTGILKETYAPSKEEHKAKDTIYFYFTSKLKDVDLSFSKKLDSIKKMKLFKIHLLFNGDYDEERKMTLPKTEVDYEIKEIPFENKEKIAGYFKLYKAHIPNK